MDGEKNVNLSSVGKTEAKPLSVAMLEWTAKQVQGLTSHKYSAISLHFP